MARIRTIKPEFFTSEDIVGLSPLARLLYIALWCEADREGRLVWKPKTFKLRYLPADDCDVDALCDELTGSGLVHLYGDGLAMIPTFAAHQHVNPRESASQLPEPPRVGTRAARVKHASPRVDVTSARDSDAQGGRERKGTVNDASRVALFERFWLAYPKRLSKGQAEKAFAKIAPDEQLVDRMLTAIERAKTSEQWRKDNGQFVPHPATWLNAKGWEDELAPPPEQELPWLHKVA